MLGRPGLDNEVGSSVVPVHLVSLSLQPRTLLSCLPFHVFVLLSFLRAHLHIRPSLNFCFPSGRRVCVTLGVIGILLDLFSIIAGGLVVHASTSPTKRLALNTDIGGDAHRRTCNFPTFPCGKRLSQEPH